MMSRLSGIVAVVTLSVGLAAIDKTPVTVEDCVGLRSIVADEVRTSPDGTSVAYITKAPNLRTDQNDFGVWVRGLNDRTHTEGRLVFSSTKALSGLAWLRGSKKLALLVGGGKPGSRIVLINTSHSQPEVIAEEAKGIFEYSIDSGGQTVAYTTFLHGVRAKSPAKDPVLVAHGFHIPFQTYPQILAQEGTGFTERKEIRMVRRGVSGTWESSAISSHSEVLAPDKQSGFKDPFEPSLSPDGRYLAFAFVPDSIPQSWSSSCLIQKYKRSFGAYPATLGLYDTKTNSFRGPLGFPSVFSPIRWSNDSSALVLPASAPVGSTWEADDCASKRDVFDYHLFAYDVASQSASEVLPAVRSRSNVDIMLWENARGSMRIRLPKENMFAKMERAGEKWREVSRAGPEMPGSVSSVTTYDENIFVGIRQESRVPADLFLYNAKTQETVALTDLNPQMKQVALGEFESVEWTNQYGGKISGNLIRPIGYEQGKKYPLVITLTWPNNDFVCDGYYSTAFPPQPLASAGFLVLIFNMYNMTSPGATQPAGPPAIQEGETMQSSVESAIDYLAKRGLADPDNVGIIGFSRSSWKVDYILTHSKYNFRAASSADSGIYNYGASWLFDGWGTPEYDAGYGGPPYGPSLQAWLVGAPAFNGDKVRTPLLMEYTGHGYRGEPLNAYEFYTGLNTLKKPVELFFYPNGDHPLDTPFERVASLQRNVDWFRFWMQGYEGQASKYDPEQYSRWRDLRKLQEARRSEMRDVDQSATSH